ncbi:hypothetical protein HF325_004871 [Metschnikowia pulcherrima]|uniref:Uncharacterized protein n=1 Tax=Metschnikowia pulcherrima TaxID=27326 RepID=A0A8H7GQA7_9ASCO|nr:hypothetical protein HF325_004871 [Metschnikowia pulcherrima]
MARSTSASTTSATPTETFSDLMSKFMTHSPLSDLTWKQKDTPAEYSLDATLYASQQHVQCRWDLGVRANLAAII